MRQFFLTSTQKLSPKGDFFVDMYRKSWLGRQDSNLGMAVPKTAALPLGDAPTEAGFTHWPAPLQGVFRAIMRKLRKTFALGAGGAMADKAVWNRWMS